jgi:hypothetical protein
MYAARTSKSTGFNSLRHTLLAAAARGGREVLVVDIGASSHTDFDEPTLRARGSRRNGRNGQSRGEAFLTFW